jgi:hypothetical protein
MSAPTPQITPTPVIPTEGWHVLHLYYHVERAQWDVLSPDERNRAKTRFTQIIQEIRATEKTQLRQAVRDRIAEIQGKTKK